MVEILFFSPIFLFFHFLAPLCADSDLAARVDFFSPPAISVSAESVRNELRSMSRATRRRSRVLRLLFYYYRYYYRRENISSV